MSKSPEFSDRNHEDKEVNLRELMTKGKTAREGTDNITDGGRKKQEALIKGLKEYSKTTGVDVSRFIEDLEGARKDHEINAVEQKMKKVATKWYATQLKRSGAFEADDHRGAAREAKELDDAVQRFETFDMTGEYSMISTLSRFEKDIQPRLEFKKKLAKQSKWVQGEYYRRIGSIEMMGSKTDLLNDILKSVEGLEDAPPALQHEFAKLQEKSKGTVSTAVLRENVQDQFSKLKAGYQTQIQKNIAYFGGKEVQTPSGKMPEAAWEFLEWFNDLDSFAKMEDASRKLPKLIAERKRLYDRRDEVINHIPEKKREALLQKTNLMRRHELEAYLPELEKATQKDNINTAEYQADLITAKESGFSLFTAFEQRAMLSRFKSFPIDQQEERKADLEKTMQDRRALVQAFLELPSHIQSEHFDAFYGAHDMDRVKIVEEAQEQAEQEKENPFAISSEKTFTNEDANAIAKNIEGKGEKTIEDLTEELQQEGEFKAAEIQAATYDKIFGTAHRAKLKKMTQEESYLDDLKYWIRLRKDVDDETDANSAKEKSKLRYIEAADVAYDEGFVFTSGGQVRELQQINKEELESGANSENVLERLSRARWGEHVKVVDSKQSERTLDPLKMIEDMSQSELLRLSMKLLEKLTLGTMKQSAANAAKLRNSRAVMQAIQNQLIEDQFSHLEDREAA